MKKRIKFILSFLLFEIAVFIFTYIKVTGKPLVYNFSNTMYNNAVFYNLIALSYILFRRLYTTFTAKETFRSNLLNTLLKIMNLVLSTGAGTFLGFQFLLYLSWVEYFPYERAAVLWNNALFAGIIFAALTIYENYRLQMRHIEDSRKQFETESKLRLLQSKLNPHFLFNTLNSLISMGYENNPQKLEYTIQSLSDIYRSILYLPDDFQITMRKELDLVKSYLEIEKIRFQERLDFEIDVPDNMLELQILPLMIELSVENAVIHGITPKKQGGKVEVKAEKHNNTIIIEVLDNGVGYDDDRAHRTSSGFGLESLRARMRMIYGSSGIFKIYLRPEGGTRVHMEVPCR